METKNAFSYIEDNNYLILLGQHWTRQIIIIALDAGSSVDLDKQFKIKSKYWEAPIIDFTKKEKDELTQILLKKRITWTPLDDENNYVIWLICNGKEYRFHYK